MNDQIRAFFAEVDKQLVPFAATGEILDLYHLGRSALILHYGSKVGTVDVDVVEDRDSALLKKALELFGKGTPRAFELRLYLDPVHPGLPPLPHGYRQRCTIFAGDWQVIRLWRLEEHDQAVSKLKSFRPQDRQDLKFLCDEGMLDPDTLRLRLESAFLWTMERDGDVDRDRAFVHLGIVIDYLEGKRAAL